MQEGHQRAQYAGRKELDLGALEAVTAVTSRALNLPLCRVLLYTLAVR